MCASSGERKKHPKKIVLIMVWFLEPSQFARYIQGFLQFEFYFLLWEALCCHHKSSTTTSNRTGALKKSQVYSQESYVCSVGMVTKQTNSKWSLRLTWWCQSLVTKQPDFRCRKIWILRKLIPIGVQVLLANFIDYELFLGGRTTAIVHLLSSWACYGNQAILSTLKILTVAIDNWKHVSKHYYTLKVWYVVPIVQAIQCQVS